MLNYLSEYFQITYLCDVSPGALERCARQVNGGPPKTTTRAEELCASDDVDAVVIANATPMHPAHAILALKNNKNVLVEKPLALCYRDIDAMQAAEDQSTAKLFVGYMRRYPPSFLEVMHEIRGLDIQYARIRDILGKSDYFVEQTGTYPKAFADIASEAAAELKETSDDIFEQALAREFGVPVNEETKRMLDVLGGLGSHDLSAMREVLGMPFGMCGSKLSWPFWTATFDYGSFPVVYESGINDVPDFEAHVEIYTNEKIVRVDYDTNWIKGLPTTMTVKEKIQSPTGETQYQERFVRTTYEDNYTIQFRDWYDCILTGRSPKTSIADARKDVDLYKMLLQSGFGKGKN